MNADRVLAHYERIADAPDAISRLRRFILNLAVRGKLVPQDPDDEHASELLRRIEREIGTHACGDLLPGSAPCELPESWIWICLGRLVIRSDAGWSPRTENHPRTDTEWGVLKVSAVSWDKFRASENKQLLRGTKPRLQAEVKQGDFLISRANTLELIARAVIVDDQPVNLLMSDKIVRLHLSKNCDKRFVLLVNNYSEFARRHYVRHASGVSPSMKNVSRDAILSMPFPLPPLIEQHRIVAEVDRLIALCDRLESAREKREATRDRLAAATLTRLSTPTNTESFGEDARFALDALPALTARPDQMKQLRQTILKLAARGRLVRQDSRDEPACELLKRVLIEKARCGVEHVVEPLRTGEVPFELPRSWCWTRIGEICLKTGSGSTPRGGRSAYKEAGIPFLRSQNVYNDGLRLEDVAYIDRETHARMAGTAVKPRDLLLNITGGSMGRCCRVPDTFDLANVSQHVAILRTALAGAEDFLHLVILSPDFQASIFEGQTGAGRGGLPKNRMDRIPIALPPLNEQRRIVAIVNELMAYFDRLEGALNARDDARSRLLSALLHDALQLEATREEAA